LPPVDYANDVTYYATGQLNTFTYGNGLTHKTTLNPANLPSSIKDSNADFTALHYGYTYDDNLNVKSLTDHRDSDFSLTNIDYDGLDRLTTVTAGAGFGNSTLNMTMTYDALGNIKTYNNRQQSLTYHYSTVTNQLDRVEKMDVPNIDDYRVFDYDERGNVTNNGLRDFNFNVANQLVSSGTNTYLYDGHNRRVKQTDSSGTSYSMYSQDGTLLYRETSDGSINYLYLGNRLIAKDGVIPEDAGDQHFYPYGSSVEGEIDDVGYTGHKFDKDLGLSYMQARYYDPMIGRFYSNDPVDALGHIGRRNPVHGFGRYTYVNNNPYRYTDPDGEFGQVLAGAGIGGLIGGGIEAFKQFKSGDGFDLKKIGIEAGKGALIGGAATLGMISAAALTEGLVTSRAANAVFQAASAAGAVAVEETARVSAIALTSDLSVSELNGLQNEANANVMGAAAGPIAESIATVAKSPFIKTAAREAAVATVTEELKEEK
jgi:RHS repeat-associated protein